MQDSDDALVPACKQNPGPQRRGFVCAYGTDCRAPRQELPACRRNYFANRTRNRPRMTAMHRRDFLRNLLGLAVIAGGVAAIATPAEALPSMVGPLQPQSADDDDLIEVKGGRGGGGGRGHGRGRGHGWRRRGWGRRGWGRRRRVGWYRRRRHWGWRRRHYGWRRRHYGWRRRHWGWRRRWRRRYWL